MSDTNLTNARIQLKIDTEANWIANASSFRPKLGELIIYSPDEKYSSPRFKVGDGNTLLSRLPFSNDDLVMKNDTYSGWYNNDYIPKIGEIIIINSETADEPAQVRIGDGSTLVKDLPVFGGASDSSANAQKLVNADGQGLNVATQGNRLVYFKDGVPTASNIYVYKTVPQDAVLTELATETEKGLLAPEEKVLLNELSEKAITKDNISSSLPTASETVKGGIMIGENLTIDNGVLSAVMPDPEEIEDATTTTSGLMSAEDKIKLNNIEAEANKIVIDDTLSTTSTNPIQNKVINSEITKLGSLITQENSATLTAAKNYTDTKISDLINSAPTTLDTLGEIAEAMTANQSVVQTLNEAIGSKANASDLTATSNKLDLHTTSKSNPHEVTAAQVGLGNVENKSVATIKNEILTKTNLEAVGVSFNTYGEFAGADAGLVPTSAGEEDKYLAADGSWKTISAPEINYPVTSVNGQTGAVNITAESLGALTKVPAEYITETELAEKGYLTSIPDNYITETELTNKGYSTFSGKYSDLSGKPSFATVATSGSYNDLSNKPAIPTALSQLTQTSSYRTVSDTEKATWNAKSNFDGNYNSLTNKPTIPTLSSSTSSTSTTTAATSSAVKAAYDLAQSANSSASNAQEVMNAVVPQIAAKSTVSVSNLASSGNTICTLTINNTPYTLRAPAAESLPIASSTVLGGVKIGSGISRATDGTISVSTTSYSGGTGITVSGASISLDTTEAKTALGLGTAAYASTTQFLPSSTSIPAINVSSSFNQYLTGKNGDLQVII